MASDPRLTIVQDTLKSAIESDSPIVKNSLCTAAILMLDALYPVAPEATVTPTVQTDEYEFEVPYPGDRPVVVETQMSIPHCNHQHQKLVGNGLRCANCDTLLQVTGIIGKHPSAAQAEWAQKAAEGTPDGPNREDA